VQGKGLAREEEEDKEGIVGKPFERARERRGEEGILVSFDGLFVPLPGSKFIYLTRPLGLKIYMKI
jgi:hypothetical protein